MDKIQLALSLPGFSGEIANNPAKNFNLTQESSTLGYVLTRFGELAIYVGGFLMFFWAAWGVFDYIRAEGNKEALAKARKRIQWAIVGFIILLLAFFMSDVVKTILNPGVPPVTEIRIK